MTRAKRIQSTPALEGNHHSSGNQDPLTERRIMEIADMVNGGAQRATCVKYMMDEWGFKDISQPSKIFNAAIRYLMPDDPEEYREQMIAKNFSRLEKIIEQSMKDRNYRVAREAIAETNKMLGLTGSKINIGQESPDGNKQIIQISFD